LADNVGTVRKRIVHGSLGEIVVQSNPDLQTRYLFTGREFDAETGLYHYRACYYDPATGRFLSVDTPAWSAGQRIPH
jgi:RHS repeat-associated protein